MTQPRRILWLAIFAAALLMLPRRVAAQSPPTSPEIPFAFRLTHPPFGSTHTITVQVWDAVTGGSLILSKVHPNVNLGFLSGIDFVRCSRALLDCRGDI